MRKLSDEFIEMQFFVNVMSLDYGWHSGWLSFEAFRTRIHYNYNLIVVFFLLLWQINDGSSLTTIELFYSDINWMII